MKKQIIPAILITFLLAISIFAQVDISRETRAITYPLDEKVMVQFRGTTRYPRMKGEAKVQRTSKNGTQIELSISKMPRPFELGAGYATYVLWAISPEGQADNLGEIRRRGFFEFDSKISVTTPLQTFALIVTAEPHFLVRRPSQQIMLENLNPYSTSGKTLATTTAVTYFGNSSDYFRDARTPEIAEVDYREVPPTILQAKQAIALAKFAGADRDATEELREAETLYQNAENAWRAGRPEDQIDITARKAISMAVKAESTAAVRKEARDKRNEKIKNDAEIRRSEEKYGDLESQLNDTKAELERERRARELAERDAANYSEQVKELRKELETVRADAQADKIKLAKIEARQEVLEKEREKQQQLTRLSENENILIRSLSRFGAVNKTDRGIVLTLPENYWAGDRVSVFSDGADNNLSGMGEVLANNVDYNVTIESHTDNKGTPDELETLTTERAQAIADKLMLSGVAQDRLSAQGMGASLPVAANTTNKNRAKNRRIDIILVPNIQ